MEELVDEARRGCRADAKIADLSPSENVADRAGCWFLHSGIQEPSGGVARYFRADLGRNAPVSTEITGYAVSALVYLHDRSGERGYLEAAVRAGRFLTREAWDTGLSIMPFEHGAHSNGSRSPAYFFDSGIIARGLLSLWRATDDREYLDGAVRCGRSMLRDFRQGPVINPILSLPEKRPLPHEPRWSRGPGCYQLKSAMAWHDLAVATGEPDFKAAYQAALETSLSDHAAFLPGEADQEKVMDRLHAYCYFLEGLQPALDRPACREALITGIDRVSDFLLRIGPIFERSDVCAQLLRARLYADAAGVCPLDREAAAREANALASFQSDSADVRLNHGFHFGRRGGEKSPHLNPVSTAFGVQALMMWREYLDGQFIARLTDLI